MQIHHSTYKTLQHPSPSRMPSIHLQIRPRHIAIRIRQQEQHRRPELVCLRQSAEHTPARPQRLQLRILSQTRCRGFGANVARTQRVDPDGWMDAIIAPFRSERAPELQQCRFARVVGRGGYALDVLLSSCKRS